MWQQALAWLVWRWVKKEEGSFASSLFSFFLFKVFVVGVGVGAGGGGLCWGIYSELSATQGAIQLQSVKKTTECINTHTKSMA